MSGADIERLLSVGAKAVGSVLADYVPEQGGRFSVVKDAMHYSLMAGGKRIRPFLVLQFAMLSAASCGGDPERAFNAALPYAAAIEMVHTYSLIHDDLPCMDDDVMRRGKPTCHVKFGEANALLAGDGLLTLAFGTALSNTQLPAETNCKAAALLAECAGVNGMIGGQVIDLIGESQSFDMETLELLQSLKTGELIRCAALLGCFAGGASSHICDAAERYAMCIGRAFQVVDDVLDVIGDETVFGKPIGSDAASGKTTFVTFMSVDEAMAYAKKLTEEAKSAVSEYEGSEILTALADYLLSRKK